MGRPEGREWMKRTAARCPPRFWTFHVLPPSTVPRIVPRSPTGQCTVVAVLKVHGQPSGKPRARNSLPSSAAIGRAEYSRGILLGRVAGDEAGFMIDKAHAVETGQGIDSGLSPSQTTVFGEEQDA